MGVPSHKTGAMIKKQGFQGYVSFESLSDGDPKAIIKAMVDEFKNEFNKG